MSLTIIRFVRDRTQINEEPPEPLYGSSGSEPFPSAKEDWKTLRNEERDTCVPVCVPSGKLTPELESEAVAHESREGFAFRLVPE